MQLTALVLATKLKTIKNKHINIQKNWTET